MYGSHRDSANSGRVTITGILSEFNTELAHGFFHSLEGWIIFVIALVMLIGLHAAINRVYAWKFANRPFAKGGAHV